MRSSSLGWRVLDFRNRFIAQASPGTLDAPVFRELMAQAVASAKVPLAHPGLAVLSSSGYQPSNGLAGRRDGYRLKTTVLRTVILNILVMTLCTNFFAAFGNVHMRFIYLSRARGQKREGFCPGILWSLPARSSSWHH